MNEAMRRAITFGRSLPVEYEHKVWGKTACISKHAGFTVYHLVVKANVYCSRHYHEHRFNGFFVSKGTMLIREYDENWQSVKATELSAGGYYEVPPGVRHRFETREECEAIEIYFPPDVRENDITRYDEGGEF